MIRNRLLGEFSKIILSMYLVHVQHLLGSQRMSLFILMWIFFLVFSSVSKITAFVFIAPVPFVSFLSVEEPGLCYVWFPPLNTCLLDISVCQEWLCHAPSWLNQDQDNLDLVSLPFSPSHHHGVLPSISAFTSQDQGAIISCLVESMSIVSSFFLLHSYSKATRASV